MFHKSNLGKFASNLEGLADRNGFIPETGDTFQSGDFSNIWEDETPTADEWQEFLADAIEATSTAESALRQWQAPSFIQDEMTRDLYTNWHADSVVRFDRMAAFGDREPDEDGAIWTVAGVLDYLKGTGFTLEGCTQPRDGVVKNAAGATVIEVID